MKVLIINQPLRNRGDESAHKALIRTFCKEIPSIKISVLFNGANEGSVEQFQVNKPHVDYIQFKSRRKAFHFISKLGQKTGLHFLWHIHPDIRRFMAYYRSADLVVCAPGGICMGGFQNWAHLFNLQLAKHLKKPLAYYGRSFGPFPIKTMSNRIYKKISLSMLRYFSFLSIRDKESEKIAKTLGLKYVSVTDTAFLDSPKVELPFEIFNVIKNKEYVVFVPNLLIWHYAYKGKISLNTILSFYSNMLNILFEAFPNCNVIMLPQTFNYRTYEGDDINLFKEIAENKQDSRIIVLNDSYSSDIQQTLIAGAKMMIGARYHSIVFAINNNIPFVALSYEHKISGLLETLNQNDSMIDLTHTFESPESISSALLQFEKCIKTSHYDNTVQQKAKEFAKNGFEKLKALLFNRDINQLDLK